MRAQIGQQVAAQREEIAFGIQGEFDIGNQIAALVVREEGLACLLYTSPSPRD